MRESPAEVMDQNDTDKRASNGIRVIARAADIMRELGTAEEGLSLTDLAERVGLPRSTVHRIASALAEEHFVLWTSPRGLLRLGPGLIPLGNMSRRSLRDMARPSLQELSRRLNETVELVVLQGDTILFLDQVVAPQRLRLVSSVGAAFPVHCTASGKAFLAALPEEETQKLLPARLERYTPHTITSKRELMKELEVVRETGVAFDHEEFTEGISATACVIHDSYGDLASLTVPMPTQRFTGQEQIVAQALLQTCERLNRLLASS